MNYQCVMSDGELLRIEADNASDAMQEAITKHRGHRIVECYLGVKGEGHTSFEIPAHDPLPKRKKPERPIGQQVSFL